MLGEAMSQWARDTCDPGYVLSCRNIAISLIDHGSAQVKRLDSPGIIRPIAAHHSGAYTPHLEATMSLKLLTVTLMVALAVAISSRPTFASDKTEVVNAVNRYLSNLDRDKIQTAVAMCDPDVSILDEFTPYAWHGPTACADWWKGLLAYDEKSGITNEDATLGKPWTVDVTGDKAYFVAPMTYTYKQNGKSVKESASFAVALKRTQGGWRITSWTYSKQTLE